MKLADVKRKAAPVLKAHGIARASVFGSTARGTAGAGSDVDFLVRLGRPTGMIGYMRLVGDLEDALGSGGDVVTERTLHPMVRDRVLAEAEEIYVA